MERGLLRKLQLRQGTTDRPSVEIIRFILSGELSIAAAGGRFSVSLELIDASARSANSTRSGLEMPGSSHLVDRGQRHQT